MIDDYFVRILALLRVLDKAVVGLVQGCMLHLTGSLLR